MSVLGCDMGSVTVSARVVVPKKVDHVCNAQIIVNEASKKDVCLIVTELGLSVPGKVVL